MKNVLCSCLTIIGLSCFAQNVPTVTIGTQIWMAKNLESAQYQNGATIRQVQDREAWVQVTENGEPAWAYYYDEAMGKPFGYLYNIHVISQGNPCPKGFRVPTNQDWEKLFNFLGPSAGLAMKSTTGWESGPGTNSSGFNALPTGFRGRSGGFNSNTNEASFWSSSSHPDQGLWTTILSWHTEATKLNPSGFGGGFNCRCIKE